MVGVGEGRSADRDPRDLASFAVHRCLSRGLPAVLGQRGRGQCSGSEELGKHAAAARSVLLLGHKTGGKSISKYENKQKAKCKMYIFKLEQKLSIWRLQQVPGDTQAFSHWPLRVLCWGNLRSTIYG